MKPAAMVRKRCLTCRRDIPVTSAGRFRLHAVIPGGQEPCPGSGYDHDAEPVHPPMRRRSPAELSRWCGPRLWVDADLPHGIV